MSKVRVIYSVDKGPGSKSYPWRVEEKTGLFKWVWRGNYQTKEEAVAEAKRIESMPYEGEVVYETITGYGN